MKKENKPKNKGTKKYAKPEVKEDSLKDKLSRSISENEGVLKFILIFLFVSVILEVLFLSIAFKETFIRETTALIVAFFLNLIGVPALVDGNLVMLNTFPLEIVYECVAVHSAIIYAACVLAYPVLWRKKAVGMLGVPVLYFIDVIRLVTLGVIGSFYPAAFEYVHQYVWQVGTIIFIVIVFVVWIDKVAKKDSAEPKKGGGDENG